MSPPHLKKVGSQKLKYYWKLVSSNCKVKGEGSLIGASTLMIVVLEEIVMMEKN